LSCLNIWFYSDWLFFFTHFVFSVVHLAHTYLYTLNNCIYVHVIILRQCQMFSPYTLKCCVMIFLDLNLFFLRTENEISTNSESSSENVTRNFWMTHIRPTKWSLEVLTLIEPKWALSWLQQRCLSRLGHSGGTKIWNGNPFQYILNL